MENVKTVFVQVVQKPERNVIIKRGVKASEYFEYCSEVGCDVWGLLLSMKSLCGEPVCLWLPEKYRKPGTSEYLLFRGEPFQEEDFFAAIEQVWDAEKKYDPLPAGYAWDTSNPRIQLEPRGERGYIELVPVKKLKQ